MIKFTQGDYPIYIAKQHIIAVKPDLNGATKIVTTGQQTSDGAIYSAFKVEESIEEVIAAIDGASNKGASE
tara:strand:- start:449 stop:661 length:213 start_codon:yes stop_codon:yes gene_type:complete